MFSFPNITAPSSTTNVPRAYTLPSLSFVLRSSMSILKPWTRASRSSYEDRRKIRGGGESVPGGLKNGPTSMVDGVKRVYRI